MSFLTKAIAFLRLGSDLDLAEVETWTGEVLDTDLS
jgi:hypothetical protein